MRYSRQAERDILDIWLYIAASSIPTADRVLDLIKSRCSQLDEFPLMGPPRIDIFAGAHALVTDRWLAIYEFEKNGAQIIRIVDAARDLGGLTFPQE